MVKRLTSPPTASATTALRAAACILNRHSLS